MALNNRLIVLYGSQTFTAQEIAEKIWRATKALGFRGPVQAMDDYPINQLIREEFAIFVCATAGQGDEPDNMKRFWKFLLKKNLPSNSLVKLKFGVLALGDSSFMKFNYVGKKLHKRLIQLGAMPLLNVGLCDYQHDMGHDAVMIPWLKEYWEKLKLFFPSIPTDNIDNKFIPRWKIQLLKNSLFDNVSKDGTINEDIYFSSKQNYDFFEPKRLTLVNNVRTTDESHFQDVRLLVFKPSDGVKLFYKPGDILNLRPRNSAEDISELFEIFSDHNMDIEPHYRLSVTEFHDDMPVPEFLKEPLTMYEIAEQYWDLKFIPTQYVFSLLAQVSEDKLERDKCFELSSPEGQEEWLNYCRRPRRTILEVLRDFYRSTAKLTLEIIFELFSPIKPRSFSLASSSLASDGQSVELLVAVVKYYSKLKNPRLGLASNWLKTLKKGNEIYGWFKNGTFVFPTDKNTPSIMIGPGAGVAPFRSYIFERESQNRAGKDILFLYFGCRYEKKDFHCREEFERLVKDNKLTLVCAFSRDQEHKIYVQHKITETRDYLWPLIRDKRAVIFISGNAKNMPDNVKEAFVDLFQKCGGMSLEEANEYIKNMEVKEQLQIETW